MKKVTPNGAAVKLIRKSLENGATQKELSHAAGISERLLREIENKDAAQPVATISRLAKALGVHREQIVLALDGSKTVPSVGTEPLTILPDEDEDRLIPRHDYDFARATMDEGHLFKSALSATDIVCHFETALNEETGAYAQELLNSLSGLTWSRRDILEDLPATEEMVIRRRLRQLLVLLKGNDVWVYETNYIRRLPERYDLAPPDQPSHSVSRVSLVFGPPGEYGETTMRIPIDNGQPYILPSWNSIRAKMVKKA